MALPFYWVGLPIELLWKWLDPLSPPVSVLAAFDRLIAMDEVERMRAHRRGA